MGFAIVTTVVCMLAARSGDNLAVLPTSQRVWLAVLCGLLLAAMLSAA